MTASAVVEALCFLHLGHDGIEVTAVAEVAGVKVGDLRVQLLAAQPQSPALAEVDTTLERLQQLVTGMDVW